VSTLAVLLQRMREHADAMPEELDLGIPLRRDLFDKLLETNKEEK
jgi:hypothetical protein